MRKREGFWIARIAPYAPRVLKKHLCTCSFCAPFSQWCWRFLHIQWDTSLEFMEMIIQSRRDFQSKVFSEIIILAVWAIWAHRRWRSIFKEEFRLIIYRAKPSLKLELDDWLSSFQ
ncbi:hypothetical protein HU200_033710 [Digitaria exilis]|uniref:Uncharacterized protein n=1 Tax=Digitaria exilis TaxID=1010633 RepID=A0A835BUU5_9POAL|nr:hypothetical protein HU200_033710 [Digitaria exilis]